jgi:hypothetical protein
MNGKRGSNTDDPADVGTVTSRLAGIVTGPRPFLFSFKISKNNTFF